MVKDVHMLGKMLGGLSTVVEVVYAIVQCIW